MDMSSSKCEFGQSMDCPNKAYPCFDWAIHGLPRTEQKVRARDCLLNESMDVQTIQTVQIHTGEKAMNFVFIL